MRIAGHVDEVEETVYPQTRCSWTSAACGIVPDGLRAGQPDRVLVAFTDGTDRVRCGTSGRSRTRRWRICSACVPTTASVPPVPLFPRAVCAASVLLVSACGADPVERSEPAASSVQAGTQDEAQRLLDVATRDAVEDGVGGYSTELTLDGQGFEVMRSTFDLEADVSTTEMIGGEDFDDVVMQYRRIGDRVFANTDAFGDCWGAAQTEAGRDGAPDSAPPGLLLLLDPQAVGLETGSATSVVASVRSDDLLALGAPKLATAIGAEHPTRSCARLDVVAGRYQTIDFDLDEVLADLEADGVDVDAADAADALRDAAYSVQVEFGWSARVDVEEPPAELVFDLSDPSQVTSATCGEGVSPNAPA